MESSPSHRAHLGLTPALVKPGNCEEKDQFQESRGLIGTSFILESNLGLASQVGILESSPFRPLEVLLVGYG